MQDLSCRWPNELISFCLLIKDLLQFVDNLLFLEMFS